MATVLIIGVQSVTAPSPTVNTFAGPSRMNFGTTETTGTMRWPVTGVFRNAILLASSAPGAGGSGKSLTFTLRQNSTTDTAMALALVETATTVRYTASDISFTAGDLITWKCVPVGTPTIGTSYVIVVEFEAATVCESGYGWPMELLSTTLTRWNGVLQGQAWGSTSGPAIADIFAVDGTITGGYFDLDGSPGGGNSYTANLYLSTDGGATYVKQDGTGGTANTTITLAGAGSGPGITTGTFTANVAVLAGNLAYWEVVPASGPSLRNGRCSVKFVATRDGEAMFPGSNSSAPSTTTTNYGAPAYVDGTGWTATSTAHTVIGAVTRYVLGNFYVAIPAGSPGGVGKQYVYSYRRNNASPGNTPSVTIANAAITGSDLAGYIVISDGDTLNLQVVPTGTPTARRPSWCARQTIVPRSGPLSRVRVMSFGW